METEEQKVPFENMPLLMTQLICKVDEMNATLQQLLIQSRQPSNLWLNVDELREYLPDHPARQTIYCWISQRIIPYHKKGKKLQFLKSEIDSWLLEEKHITMGEIESQVNEFMEKRKARRNQI